MLGANMAMTSPAPSTDPPDRRLSRADAVLIGTFIVFAATTLDGHFKESLHEASRFVFGLFDFTKFVLIPAAVLGWLYLRYSVAPRDYGVKALNRGDGWLRTVGLVALLVALLYFAYHGSVKLAWIFTWQISAPATFYYKDTVPAGWLHYPVVFYYGLTAGIVEEIFFRGLPLLYLREKFGQAIPRTSYVIVTAIAFGLIHWENGLHEVIATTVFGAGAAVLYLQVRNLWPLIAAHALIDIWEFS